MPTEPLLRDLIDSLLALADGGGLVVWIIFGLSIAHWFHSLHWLFELRKSPSQLARRRLPSRLPKLQSTGFVVKLIRGELEFGHALVESLPLLGLLGTVIGMIEAFDALANFGFQNPRALATGISRALTTTMVGLVAAVAGLFVLRVLAWQLARWRRRATAIASTGRADALEDSPPSFPGGYR